MARQGRGRHSSSPTLVSSGTGKKETFEEVWFISVHCVFARWYTPSSYSHQGDDEWTVEGRADGPSLSTLDGTHTDRLRVPGDDVGLRRLCSQYGGREACNRVKGYFFLAAPKNGEESNDTEFIYPT